MFETDNFTASDSGMSYPVSFDCRVCELQLNDREEYLTLTEMFDFAMAHSAVCVPGWFRLYGSHTGHEEQSIQMNAMRSHRLDYWRDVYKDWDLRVVEVEGEYSLTEVKK